MENYFQNDLMKIVFPQKHSKKLLQINLVSKQTTIFSKTSIHTKFLFNIKNKPHILFEILSSDDGFIKF